jgi:hypothetical protein
VNLVRELNEEGIRRLVEFLASFRTDAPQGRPVDILTDPRTSHELPCEIEVESRNFATRLEAAQYLDEVFQHSNLVGIETNRGMWAWLSLFYFDQLCPADGHGRREPKEMARWIPEVNNYQRYYRHLLAGPYRIYRAHRDCPERALALLHNPLHKPGDIVGQIASRQEYVTNKAVVEAATKLYIEPASRTAKRGAQTKGPGGPRRFAAVLNQLDVTWDLYAMTADEILEMLPSEFNRFKKSAAGANA